jgi:hypothetical protein
MGEGWRGEGVILGSDGEAVMRETGAGRVPIAGVWLLYIF